MADPQLKDSFGKFASAHTVIIFDSYSGTGNGCVTLKQQFSAMAAVAGVHEASVQTITACEKERGCQTFLRSLHAEYQPKQICSDLDLHVTEDGRIELNRARLCVHAELEWALRISVKQCVCCSFSIRDCDSSPLFPGPGTTGAEPNSPEEAELKSKHGVDLLDRYMDILSDSDVWNTHCTCATCQLKEGLTPVGWSEQIQQEGCGELKAFRVHIGGSTCVDVSGMGALTTYVLRSAAARQPFRAAGGFDQIPGDISC